jgi:pimeloyl-ACP methyl ester carboxylesterase
VTDETQTDRAFEFFSAGAVPPFQERAPWFGGDLQTLRNVMRGARPTCPAASDCCSRSPMATGWRPGLTALPVAFSIRSSCWCTGSPARHFVGQGWPVLRLNLRGAGPSRATAAGHYHAGRTDDLAAALRRIPGDLARHGLVVLGYSLGGNLVLKFIGEGAHGLPVLAGVAVSAPIDLAAACARMIARRNVVYQRFMLKAMKREALAPAPGSAPTNGRQSQQPERSMNLTTALLRPVSAAGTPPTITKTTPPNISLAALRGRRWSCTHWTTHGFRPPVTPQSAGRGCRSSTRR